MRHAGGPARRTHRSHALRSGCPALGPCCCKPSAPQRACRRTQSGTSPCRRRTGTAGGRGRGTCTPGRTRAQPPLMRLATAEERHAERGAGREIRHSAARCGGSSRSNPSQQWRCTPACAQARRPAGSPPRAACGSAPHAHAAAAPAAGQAEGRPGWLKPLLDFDCLTAEQSQLI